MNKKSIQIVIHLNFMVYKEVNSFEKNHNQFTIRNSNPKLNLLFIQIEATYVDWEKGIGKLKVLFPLLFIQKKDRKKFASKKYFYISVHLEVNNGWLVNVGFTHTSD